MVRERLTSAKITYYVVHTYIQSYLPDQMVERLVPKLAAENTKKLTCGVPSQPYSHFAKIDFCEA